MSRNVNGFAEGNPLNRRAMPGSGALIGVKAWASG